MFKFGILLLLFTGSAEARIAVFPLNISLSTRVGMSDYASIRVKNQGTEAVRISVQQTGGLAFRQNHSCFRPLEPNTSCEINVRFQPDRAGQFYGSIHIYSNDGNATVQLNGSARPR